jgi:hypothetical protein
MASPLEGQLFGPTCALYIAPGWFGVMGKHFKAAEIKIEGQNGT